MAPSIIIYSLKGDEIPLKHRMRLAVEQGWVANSKLGVFLGDKMTQAESSFGWNVTNCSMSLLSPTSGNFLETSGISGTSGHFHPPPLRMQSIILWHCTILENVL